MSGRRNLFEGEGFCGQAGRASGSSSRDIGDLWGDDAPFLYFSHANPRICFVIRHSVRKLNCYMGGEGDMVVQQGQRRTAETFTIVTRDSYGDGWNAGMLSLTDVGSGEVVATSTGPESSCKYNPPDDTCEMTETVSLDCGSFSVSQAGSNFNDECLWVVKDSAGSTVAEASGTSSANLLVTCASCGLGSGAVSETECEACPEGKYSDVDGPGSCKRCEAGTHR